MAEIKRTTYTWSAFNLDAALQGALVGIQNTEDSTDIRKTGHLVKATGRTTYSIYFGSTLAYVDEQGIIVECISNPSLVKQALKIVTSSIVVTQGTSMPTTRAAGEEVNDVTTLASLEIRDQFAIQILNGMLSHLDAAHNYDDANIMSVCTAAYKWAQGMMQASADSRVLKKTESGGGESGGGSGGSGEEGSGSTRAPVDTSNGTDTEKLLGNLVDAVDSLTKETKKFTKTIGEGDTATTVLNIPDLAIKDGVAITNKEDTKLQIEGGGGGNSLTRNDVNDTGSDITDVVVYNTAIGVAPARATISNFANKIVSVLKLDWLFKKGDTAISDASTFFTAYKEDIATLLADKFDSKGSADKALTDAKAYTDSKITNS